MNAMLLEQAGQGENIAHIVVHDKHFPADKRLVGLAQPFQHLPLATGQIGSDEMEEQRHFVEQPLGRLHVFEDHALGHPCQTLAVVFGQVFARADDDRQFPQRRILPDVLHEIEARDVG